MLLLCVLLCLFFFVCVYNRVIGACLICVGVVFAFLFDLGCLYVV